MHMRTYTCITSFFRNVVSVLALSHWSYTTKRILEPDMEAPQYRRRYETSMKNSLHFSGSIEINLKCCRSAFNYIFNPYRTCTYQFLLPVKGNRLSMLLGDLQNLFYTDQVKMLCIHKLLLSIYNICCNTSSRFVI